MNREPSDNMIKDVIKMVDYELHQTIGYEKAECIAKNILSTAKDRESVYRVSTSRLEKLVNQCGRE